MTALVGQARRAGQEIELKREGALSSFDQGLGASLYRIVQESLTNARKHAPGARVRVLIRYLADSVEVEVTNKTVHPTPLLPRLPGARRGLIGIHERAAVLGGTAESGPTADGFRVFARLPLDLVRA